jgi:Calcineurin-like phosphoesterase
MLPLNTKHTARAVCTVMFALFGITEIRPTDGFTQITGSVPKESAKSEASISEFRGTESQTIYDLSPGTQVSKASPSPDASSAQLTIYAYGDSRTGPWGLGDNRRQKLHQRMVDAILASPNKPDAVLFTGDAVMSNFFLWKDAYWKDFRKQSDRFELAKPNIAFYPSLGNHEAETNKPVLMQALNTQVQLLAVEPSEPNAERETRVGDAYEAAEDQYGSLMMSFTAAGTGEQTKGIDLSDKNQQAALKKLTETLDQAEKGNMSDQIKAAASLGQAEAAVQQEYYADLLADGGCGKDAKLLSDGYEGYAELNSRTSGERSFYSVVVSNGELKTKIIALDTNCLNSTAQQNFFKAEVEAFDGPIIVFGHHPPINENLPAPYWDKPPGWDAFKPYFDNPKIRLWIFGHVHNYQRRNAQADTSDLKSPVLVITGGGGASLSKTPTANQWQPDIWPNLGTACAKSSECVCKAGIPCLVPAYNFLKLSIMRSQIAVDAFGASKNGQPFALIDHFTVKID